MTIKIGASIGGDIELFDGLSIPDYLIMGGSGSDTGEWFDGGELFAEPFVLGSGWVDNGDGSFTKAENDSVASTVRSVASITAGTYLKFTFTIDEIYSSSDVKPSIQNDKYGSKFTEIGTYTETLQVDITGSYQVGLFFGSQFAGKVSSISVIETINP